MAPARQKKARKSTESITKSPIKKSAPMGLTVGQKQALIDNLQLEITERARKLRAQYMLQAQGLRTRIEIRVNRIPMALRRANMGELLAKHSEKPKAIASRLSPAKMHSPGKNLNLIQREQSRLSPSPQRPTSKRLSDAMTTDKENEDAENPKKKARGAPEPPARTTSRAALQPEQVLSPRSANLRVPPKPTTRAVPTTKALPPRSHSPLKTAVKIPSGGAAGLLNNMVEKAKSTRGAAARKVAEVGTAAAGAGRTKRAAAAPAVAKPVRGRAASDSSNASGSTVIRKAPPPKKAPAPAKRTVMGTLKGMGAAKKTAAAPKAAPVTGGRVLRKRA